MPNDGTDAWFLELIMRSKKQYLNQIAPQAAQKNINVGILKTLEVPLPSLDVQLQIVDEVKAEQAAVDHARDLAARMQGRIDAAIGRVWGEMV
jgi:restriction endonuclease S subunit